ncbi:uncharacterized protein [Eurosta solidaginis]|uniref:uncharacterized protein isoform X2 n=1 Tax=Eurosta solidaginis TaxID=178769 RepID=UPI0035309459
MELFHHPTLSIIAVDNTWIIKLIYTTLRMQGYNNIIKYENECNTTQPSEYEANNSAQFSFVDVSNEANANTTESDDIPVIVNGKYFKIIEELNATEYQRVSRGIIAVCRHCPRGKARSIQGSMRITSNFVRHLKTLHPAKYEEFIIERQNQSRNPRCKRGRKRKSSQLECQGNNGNNSKTDGYTDEDTNAQSPEGVGTYCDDTQPSSAHNAENADIYSAESNETHGSDDESMEKSEIPGSSQHPCDPNEIPTILNGKYFKIIEHDSNRSVIAACQLCETDKMVKGPLKVSSNFVQHLRLHHFKEYKMYIQEKSSGSRCRRYLNRQPTQLPFIDKVVNFILVCNVPISVVEEPTFIELFRNTGITMCSRAQLLARLDEMSFGFVENIKRSIQEVPYLCVTADIWTSRRKQYFGYCAFWLDNNLKRQMAVLACVRLSKASNYNDIEALIGQIHGKYDLSDQKITCVIVDGVQDFVHTYHKFSIKSICVDSYDEDFNFALSNSQHLLSQLPKTFKRGEDSLHLLTVLDFSNILQSNETLQQVLKRCLYILNNCKEFDADEISGFIYEGNFAPNDTRWPAWYASLTQLIKNKHKIDEICTFLKVTKFTSKEIEFIEEFCMLLKPIADALEFLQQDTYLYFGYFLPTLITIKVKLKKLHDSRHIKHLHTAAQQMSEALFNRLRKYFEMKRECNDAIIAAIVCPAIKMRFVEALHETAPDITTDSLIQLFIDYAQEFYVDNNQADNVREQRPPSVDSFLCFNQDDNEDPPSDSKPNVSIRKEFTNYLHDEDKSLACLNRYQLVKKVFHKYNTMPPTSVTLEQFFQTFLNVSDGQRGQQLSDDHFERLVLIKSNKVF